MSGSSSRRSYRDRSPDRRERSRDNGRDRSTGNTRSSSSAQSYNDRFGTRQAQFDHTQQTEQDAIVKELPNYELTGVLDEDITADGAGAKPTKTGVELAYHEPQDAATTDILWRFYVFKQGKNIETLHIHRKRFYRIGRDKDVCDIVVGHPSCSKQHAVIQYRRKVNRDATSQLQLSVRPYVIDLGSTNGTFINSERIEKARFYELLEKDCLKFGNSSREYILLHTES